MVFKMLCSLSLGTTAGHVHKRPCTGRNTSCAVVVFATSSPVVFKEMIYVHVHVPFLSLGVQCDIVLSQRPLSYASQLKGVLHTIIGVYQVKDTLDEVRKDREGELKEEKIEEEGRKRGKCKSGSHPIFACIKIVMRFCGEMRAKKLPHTSTTPSL